MMMFLLFMKFENFSNGSLLMMTIHTILLSALIYVLLFLSFSSYFHLRCCVIPNLMFLSSAFSFPAYLFLVILSSDSSLGSTSPTQGFVHLLPFPCIVAVFLWSTMRILCPNLANLIVS